MGLQIDIVLLKVICLVLLSLFCHKNKGIVFNIDNEFYF